MTSAEVQSVLQAKICGESENAATRTNAIEMTGSRLVSPADCQSMLKRMASWMIKAMTSGPARGEIVNSKLARSVFQIDSGLYQRSQTLTHRVLPHVGV